MNRFHLTVTLTGGIFLIAGTAYLTRHAPAGTVLVAEAVMTGLWALWMFAVSFIDRLFTRALRRRRPADLGDVLRGRLPLTELDSDSDDDLMDIADAVHDRPTHHPDMCRWCLTGNQTLAEQFDWTWPPATIGRRQRQPQVGAR